MAHPPGTGPAAGHSGAGWIAGRTCATPTARERWSRPDITPIPNGVHGVIEKLRCTFVDLKPDTEYEVQVTSKNSTGEGEPVYAKIRTNPEGGSENIIPFRKR